MDEQIEIALSMLRDCPFCSSRGRETRLVLGGQIWRGMSYSEPQYWELRHFCLKPKDDPFVDGVISFRVRVLDDAVRRWNSL